MKATLKLLALPFVRMPVGMSLLVLTYVAGMAAMVLLRSAEIVVGVGAAGWLVTMLSGMTLRTLQRPETRLLPGFHRHLATAGAVYALLLVVVPTGVAMALGGKYLLLTAAGLLLAASIGLATGLGSQLMLLVWLLLIGIGWVPDALLQSLATSLVTSPWVPLLFVLVAVAVLMQVLRPFWTLVDRPDDVSPMDASLDGRRSLTDADGAPRNRGPMAQRITAVFDILAQRTQARALTSWQRHPGTWSRLTLLRTVLLPRDGLTALLLRIGLVAAIAVVYFLAIRSARQWDAGYLGAYAVILGVARFAAVGQGMTRMRPNLADLYLTLAPSAPRDFQRTLADVLLWLVLTAVLSAVAYSGIIAILLHAPDAPHLLLATGITAVAAAFSALAAHLVGPESTLGRGIANLVILGGAVLAYALVYWLLGRFGLLVGAVLGLILTLPFGLGGWQAARREYLRRAPRFDVPL